MDACSPPYHPTHLQSFTVRLKALPATTRGRSADYVPRTRDGNRNNIGAAAGWRPMAVKISGPVESEWRTVLP
jgi:hypothetical protein